MGLLRGRSWRWKLATTAVISRRNDLRRSKPDDLVASSLNVRLEVAPPTAAQPGWPSSEAPPRLPPVRVAL